MSTLEATQTGPGWPRWRRALWYHAAFYRLTWRASVISSFLFPILYLASMGLGVGSLVSTHTGLVEGQTYLHFVAPGLLAITAMQLGTGESMWPILGAVKWVRTYHAAVATPLEPEDVLTGKLAFVGLRLLMTATVYTVIIACFGAVSSWWGVLLPAVGVLTGLAFAAPLIAYALTVESDSSFSTIFRFLIVPMFLFSATFYPVATYPPGIRWVVQLMPLYHGVALARGFAFGGAPLWPMVAHVAVLSSLFAVGVVVARRHMRRRLVS
jgi:lipooligosaccharide transport system permease protein